MEGETVMGEILAVCISEKKGEQKHPVPQAELRENWGIVGDAHAGPWHRQVSLLGQESVEKLRAQLPDVTLGPGDFAENLLVRGLTLYTLPVGTRLKLGAQVMAEVTQIGKTCHKGCAIRRLTGDCVMPREGIFVRILTPGTLRPGDPIAVIPEE